jgi:RNA polymerase sigma factor (sigma-70 family)
MYKVCRNLAIDYLRRRDRGQIVATEWKVERERKQAEATVEERMDWSEQIEILLDELNERERHCLLMRADGLSYKEIAQALEISAKAVSVYLVRGLKKFRREGGQAGNTTRDGSQTV